MALKRSAVRFRLAPPIKTNELTKNEILASFPNLVVSYKLATARQPLPAESSGLCRPWGCRSALYPAALSFSPGRRRPSRLPIFDQTTII